MIEQPYGLIKHIDKLETEYKDAPVFGCDTETPGYTIKLLIISDGNNAWVIDVSGDSILDEFIDFFRNIPHKHIIVFFHNLTFDMGVLMNMDLDGDCQLLLPECEWLYRDVKIEYFQGPPHFGRIKYRDGKILELRDTFAFFGRIKLGELSKSLKVGEKIEFEEFDLPEVTNRMREYAGNDAILTARIGARIMDYHAMYDISLCVSAPAMAMKVFRKQYIKEPLLPPPHEYVRWFELSYHGGKNGCYTVTPVLFNHINVFDINSAYPSAMTEIVNFAGCTYHERKRFDEKSDGIWLISGLSTCPYNTTFFHDFSPIKKMRGIWITSFELKELIERNEIKDLIIHKGIIVKGHRDYNPLAEYARTFYKLKSDEPKDSPLYLHYKIGMLNSLYGKYIERRISPEQEIVIRGSSYNPAIASLITGHARAKLHALEHMLNSIHSATDSVMTEGTTETSKGLGGLSLEAHGKLKLFRTKCYIIEDESGKVVKHARHGFHGKLEQLQELWEKKKRKYIYTKIPTIKEAFLHKKLKRKLWGMNKFKAELKIDWSLLCQMKLFKNCTDSATDADGEETFTEILQAN